jgi:hypothetical protein
MKTSLFFKAICVALLLISPAVAQMHVGQSDDMPMNMEMMQGHMTSMAGMMSEMADVMRKGTLTPEQQEQCAAFVQRMSGLMSDMASDPKQERAGQRQRELEETEKEWNYWKEQEEH